MTIAIVRRAHGCAVVASIFHAAIRRQPPERLLAWLFTGPAGHLWSVAADVVTLWPPIVARTLARVIRR
jgi:hypothetical protein